MVHIIGNESSYGKEYVEEIGIRCLYVPYHPKENGDNSNGYTDS